MGDLWNGFKPSIFISTKSLLLANRQGTMETGSELFPGIRSGEHDGVLTKPRSSAAGPSLSSDFASLWAARGREKQTLPPPHPVENQGFNLTLSRKIEAERTSSLDGGRGGEGRC